MTNGEQYTVVEPWETKAAALERAKCLAGEVRTQFERDGFTTFTAPAAGCPGAVELCEVRDGFRLIVMWVPDWAPNQHAGKWVARVDTVIGGKG